jgi:2-dehydro-3-deoxygalactonokinase
MSEPTSILIDWGTTNFRAWLVGRDGVVLERTESDGGIMRIGRDEFPKALEFYTEGWRSRHPGLPVLMSGMVGSKQGWAEAPYAPCPAGIADLACAVLPVPGEDGVSIVPGISYESPDCRHDVMRGEEVQIFGALATDVGGRQVFCLPGTHSKWAAVEDGRVVWFATSMTGEIWSVMAEHSILGRLMEGEASDDMDAFRRGVTLSGESGGLLNHLFAVRAEGLFGAIPATGLRAYLSGILIGHEVRAMIGIAALAGPVTLIGRPDVTALYADAIAVVGQTTTTVTAEDATLKGLTLIQEAIQDE